MTSFWCHKCRRRCVALERYDEGVRCGTCHEGFIEETDDSEEDGNTSRESDQRSQPGTPQQGPPPLVIDGDDNPFDAFPGSPFARLFQHIHQHIFAGVAPPTVGAAGAPAATTGGNVRPTMLIHRRSASEGPSPNTSPQQRQHPQPTAQHGTATPPPTGPYQQQNAQQHHQHQFFFGHPPPHPQQEQQGNVQPPNNNDLLTHFMDQVLGPLINHAQTNNAGGRTQVIIQLGGDGTGPAGGGGLFNIHGNLQDYAWGDHGLDNVLTALLNTFDGAQQQMRSLRPEDIAKLPMSKVTQKQVDNGTQCTTCMEFFALDETVGKLDCEHIFHPDCLKPWLARNNTCPICRKVIDPSNWGPIISDVDELD